MNLRFRKCDECGSSFRQHADERVCGNCKRSSQVATDDPQPAETKLAIARRPWVCPRCDLKFEIPADAPAPEICVHCQRGTHPAPPAPVIVPAELHEIAIEQIRDMPSRPEPRRRGGWTGVSVVLALLAGMVVDWLVGYRWGLHTAGQVANEEIEKANAAIESANAEVKRLVAQLSKANAEIEKANRVNGELHESLKAARLKPAGR